MKKVFVFAPFFALDLPLYCQASQESVPVSEEAPDAEEKDAGTEKNAGIKGDIFFDCSYGLYWLPGNTKIELRYMKEHRSDILECIFTVPYYLITTVIPCLVSPEELVYYRKQDDDGSYGNYFGISHPANMTMALYFGDNFYTAIKLGVGLPAVNISFIVPLVCLMVVVYYGHAGYVRHHITHDYES